MFLCFSVLALVLWFSHLWPISNRRIHSMRMISETNMCGMPVGKSQATHDVCFHMRCQTYLSLTRTVKLRHVAVYPTTGNKNAILLSNTYSHSLSHAHTYTRTYGHTRNTHTSRERGNERKEKKKLIRNEKTWCCTLQLIAFD